MQQQGGSPSQYGVPPLEMVPHLSAAAGGLRQPHMMVGIHGGAELPPHQPVAEAASPISSRSAPQPLVGSCRSPAPMFFDELGGGGGVVGTRNLGYEEEIGVGEDGEKGGGVGSRWPRQETLALLKIRSEMDAVFRDATLKGPLWEDVSRKMADQGYKRSSKKCKEKFENVHKYYKRTKEGRAGRQDGKSYRFFTQLEALQCTTTTPVATVPSFSPAINTNPSPPPTSDPPAPSGALIATHAGISFSSNTSSSSSSDSDAENTDYGVAGEIPDVGKKRKREGWLCRNGKTIAFFEKLMKQLIEKQEAMQQRFLDTIEKREQDRMVREEAWKRQEMLRLNREYELMVQERTMTANRDAAVISFLQRFTGSITNQQTQEDTQVNEIVIHQPSVSSDPATSNAEMAPDVMGVSNSSPKSNSAASRWPKTEVLALIKLRSGLELRYLETGPKGPFWEDISMGMKRLGYNRSPKRCKEKWENINKYFKKVKEGNKKRPEDAKTCPYFHELDALYRRKQQQEIVATNNTAQPVSVSVEQESNNGGNKNLIIVRNNVGNGGGLGESTGFQMPRSNANGHSQVLFGSEAPLKKPEDIVKELMEQQSHEEEEEEEEEDVVDDDDEYDDDDEEEEGKLRFEIQFQRQNVGAVGNGGNAVRKASASVSPSSNAASFLAMVQ